MLNGFKKFDIILSNFYLHLTNNFILLLKNLSESLNNNGFLFLTMPGKNCHLELKDSMINADIELYGGAYSRFMEYYSHDVAKSFIQTFDSFKS